MQLLELFRGHGGYWITLLLALAYLASQVGKRRAASRGGERPDLDRALDQRWFLVAAVAVALGAWVEHYTRLALGLAYLRGSGSHPSWPALLAIVVLAAAIVALVGTWRWAGARPWLTLGIVLALIVGAAELESSVEPGAFKEGLADADPTLARFVSQRLAVLGCFEGEEGAPPAKIAVIAFQQSNDLLDDLQWIGELRWDPEFRLLNRPFYFLDGPRPCPGEVGQGEDGGGDPG